MSSASTPTPTAPRYLSPPQYAARLGVKPGKVVAWCKTGELRAINTAAKQSSRPRFKISPDAIIAFENSRGPKPPAAPRRRRRKQADDVIAYF